MTIQFTKLKQCNVMTSDISIGHVSDLLIEEDVWIVRYLVVDLISILPNRQFLISPQAIRHFDFSNNRLLTNLASNQVLKSDPDNQHESISRRHEKTLVEYYGWPLYWLGRAAQFSPQSLEKMAKDDIRENIDDHSSSRLRSAIEMCGYQLRATDEPAGLIHDFNIDEDSWKLKSLISAEDSWKSNQTFVASTDQIHEVNWSNRAINLLVHKAILETSGDHSNSARIAGEISSSQPDSYQ